MNKKNLFLAISFEPLDQKFLKLGIYQLITFHQMTKDYINSKSIFLFFMFNLYQRKKNNYIYFMILW